MSSEAPAAIHQPPATDLDCGGGPSTLAIGLENVSKRYPLFAGPKDRLRQILFGGVLCECCALRDIHLRIHKGESLGILGRNGSGKSTLLQLISSTLTPTTGTVETRGRIAALLELGAGFHTEFTGRENVYLNARILGMTRKQTDRRFDDIAAFADIGPFIDQPVKHYSSGMYVRLAFAVIAHVDADILLIDEALSVGDALFAQKCMRYLRSFREKGTLVFVSHDAPAVLALCDRAIFLDSGSVRQEGSAKVVSEAYLADLFGHIHGRRANHPNEPEIPKNDCQELQAEEREVEPLSSNSNRSFGFGGASIRGVDVRDERGRIVQVLATHQRVSLRIHFRALKPLSRPIVGFYFKDRLGQNLFGQNTTATYCDAPPPMAVNEERVAAFTFDVPALPAGTYTIDVAVANGTMDSHTQHHWVHDAYVLTSSGRGSEATGLVGIAMERVEFRALPEVGHGL